MEDEQKLTEQQRTALSQLEDLRSELHSMVDARVDGSIHSILTGRVLEQALPTLPLTANPSVFKGEKPESILFPDGREVKTPTWKTAVLAIMRDCNADAKMHLQLMELRGKVLGRQRAILAASPEKMHAPLEIDKDLYMESYYDTAVFPRKRKNRPAAMKRSANTTPIKSCPTKNGRWRASSRTKALPARLQKSAQNSFG